MDILTTLAVGGPTQWYTYLYTALPTGGLEIRPFFLGWCQDDTKVAITGSFHDVMTDFGGAANPTDKIYSAQGAIFSGDIICTTEFLLSSLFAMLQTSTPGFTSLRDIGTLALAEARTFPIVVVSPYASLSPFSDIGMAPGYYFYSCFPVGAQDISLSVRRKVYRLSFQAIQAPRYDDLGNLLGYGIYTTDVPTNLTPDINNNFVPPG